MVKVVECHCMCTTTIANLHQLTMHAFSGFTASVLEHWRAHSIRFPVQRSAFAQ